jgi:hypothetical protein
MSWNVGDSSTDYTINSNKIKLNISKQWSLGRDIVKIFDVSDGNVIYFYIYNNFVFVKAGLITIVFKQKLWK